MKNYVLVSQGIKIYETTNKEEAEKMIKKDNERFYKYKQKCLDRNEDYADNEVFMYTEEID